MKVLCKRISKTALIVPFLLCTLLPVSFSSCTNNTVISEIQSVITGLNQILPIASSLDKSISATVIADVQTGLADANQLLAAAKATTGNAAQYLAALIPVADQILAALPPGLVPPVYLAAIMGGLAIVNIALNWLSTNLLAPAAPAVVAAMRTSTSPSDLQVIQAFAARPCWGLQLQARLKGVH
jgi:hypothetical protein